MEIQHLPHLPQSPLTAVSIKIVSLLVRKYLLVPDRAKIRSVLNKDTVRLEGIPFAFAERRYYVQFQNFKGL